MTSLSPCWTSFTVALLFTIATATSVASDQSCSSVRMDQNGGSVSTLKVQDQRDSLFCFSYAAMELFDAYRISILKASTKEHGSVTHTAALNAKLKTTEELESYAETLARQIEERKDDPKKQQQAIKNYQENVSHVQKRISDPDDEDAGEALIGMGRTNKALQLIKERKFVCSADLFQGDSDSEAAAEKLLGPLMQIRQAALKSTTPDNFIPEIKCEIKKLFKQNLNDLDQIASHIINSLPNKDDYIVSVIENSCPNKIDTTQIPDPETFTFSTPPSERRKEFPEKVNELMDKAIKEKTPPQPIAIAFQHSSIARGAAGPHGAIIVGREMVNGVCNFIIRNSYGPDCRPPGEDGEYRYPCRGGQIWVPASAIGAAVQDITWLPVSKQAVKPEK